MTSVLSEINGFIEQGASFYVYKDKKKNWHAEKRSIWNRILHYKDRSYHEKRIGKIAKVLRNEMQAQPRMTIGNALENDTLQGVRKFLRPLKTLNPCYSRLERVKECKRELLAARLGIEATVFDRNEGFEKFAEDSHLERYLADYGHELRVDSATCEILLMFEGEYQSWSAIKQKLDEAEYPAKTQSDNPRQKWHYGRDGVQKKDMYAWTDLKPYKTVENPEWGNRYLFEFVSCCNPSFCLNGDHSWLELKTPQGEIYSAGLYRPGKQLPQGNFHSPLRVKKGYLMSPDVSTWWPTDIYRIPVEITEEQFQAIKSSIEKDKANEDQRHFQLFKGNCQEYVNEKAALAGIKLETSQFVLRNITPIKLQNAYDKVAGYLPGLVKKVFYYTATFFTVIALWFLGGATIDRGLKEKGIEVETALTSFSDLFKPEKLYFHPPRYTALTVKPKIEKWRQEQINQLPEDNAEGREAVQYTLPPEYLI